MAAKFIDANEFTLSDLFSRSQEVYKIPDYQRPYSWKLEQWEQLVDDISEIKKVKDTHFLGSVVVISEDNHKAGINYYELVDGQQRLTTIMILLASIKDILKSSNKKNLVKRSENIEKKFLYVEDREGASLLKVKLSPQDNNIFSSILKNKTIDKSLENSLLNKAYKYFLEKLNDYKDLELFLDRLLDNVTLVHINAFNLHNAFKLFETLNDRGLELSAVDLIKNYVYKILSKKPPLFEEAKLNWNDMYSNVKDIEPVKFVRRFMLANYAGIISERKLYDGVKEKIDKITLPDIVKFTDALNESSEYYKQIYSSKTGDSEIDSKLTDLNLIKVLPSYSLLLKIFPLYEAQKIDKPQLLEILFLIEKFHIRWGITGQSTNELDRIYNKLCMSIDSKHNKVDLVKNEFKSYLTNITSEHFKDSFSSREFSASDTRTKYILWRLENKSDATAMNLKNINTEHILPKHLTDDWKKSIMKIDKYTDTDTVIEHEKNINRIGNFCLLEHKWNKSIKDSIFKIKRDGNSAKKIHGYIDSNFKLTKDLKKYTEWSISSIEERTKELSEKANKIWTID